MRYDVSTPISYGNEQTFWQRLGKAFKNEQTGVITVHLNALPICDRDGKVRIMLFEEKPEDRKPSGNSRPSGTPQWREELDDEIPF